MLQNVDEENRNLDWGRVLKERVKGSSPLCLGRTRNPVGQSRAAWQEECHGKLTLLNGAKLLRLKFWSVEAAAISRGVLPVRKML